MAEDQPRWWGVEVATTGSSYRARFIGKCFTTRAELSAELGPYVEYHGNLATVWGRPPEPKAAPKRR